MRHEGLRTELLRLVSNAGVHVRLVAPFMKAAVIDELLSSVDGAVPIHLYTRWRPDEVARGVSDTVVFDLARARPRTSLHLVDALHAKLYIADEHALLGSANLTAAGLGDGGRSNLELLAPVAAVEAEPFLRLLEATAWQPDQDFRLLMDRAADAIRVMTKWQPPASPLQPGESTNTSSTDPWWPSTRYPEKNLWRTYSLDRRRLTAAAAAQTQSDILTLRPPAGLSQSGLAAWVALALHRHDFVRVLDSVLVGGPQRFGAIRDLACRWMAKAGLERDPTEAWQTMSRWLLHFHAERYTQDVPGAYSEVFAFK